MFRKTFKKGLSVEASAKSGFSLVELLVVITIIAILSVAAYSAVGGNTIKARDAKSKQDISTIQQALELYFAEKSIYPPTLTGTDIPKKYLSDIPKDPGAGKHNYLYKVSGATYQIAATLENDGALANYEAYVVGNSDTTLVNTSDGLGRYLNGTVLAPCGTRLIASGKIITSDADATATNSCVPYNPSL